MRVFNGIERPDFTPDKINPFYNICLPKSFLEQIR